MLLLVLLSDQQVKGSTTFSVRAGSAVAIISSFSSSAEDRFQSSPKNGKTGRVTTKLHHVAALIIFKSMFFSEVDGQRTIVKRNYDRDLTLVWYWTSIAPENVYGTKRRKVNWFGGLRQKLCKLSAVLMSMGSSFHHLGARIANPRVFDDGNLGPPRSEGAASRLADAERSARAGVYGLTMSWMEGPDPFTA